MFHLADGDTLRYNKSGAISAQELGGMFSASRDMFTVCKNMACPQSNDCCVDRNEW